MILGFREKTLNDTNAVGGAAARDYSSVSGTTPMSKIPGASSFGASHATFEALHPSVLTYSRAKLCPRISAFLIRCHPPQNAERMYFVDVVFGWIIGATPTMFRSCRLVRTL